MEKKLKYIAKNLILEFMQENYPQWVNYVDLFIEFYDDEVFEKIININDNNEPSLVYPELLDRYFDQYFKNVIDPTKYQLTDDNKKLFLSLSKMICNMKGTKNSFDFLFKYLDDFIIQEAQDNQYNIDSFNISLIEDETWWDYNGGNYKPFRYQFEIDQPRSSIKEIIDSVHPAGFYYDFFTKIVFEEKEGDSLSMLDSAEVVVKQYPLHNSVYLRNGSIDRGATAPIIEQGTF